MRLFISEWHFHGSARGWRSSLHYRPLCDKLRKICSLFKSMPIACHRLHLGEQSIPSYIATGSFSFTPKHFPDRMYPYSWLASHPKVLAKALPCLTANFITNQTCAVQLQWNTVSIVTPSAMTDKEGGCREPLTSVECLKLLWILTVRKNNMVWGSVLLLLFLKCEMDTL